jgi:hypothetical protein
MSLNEDDYDHDHDHYQANDLVALVAQCVKGLLPR